MKLGIFNSNKKADYYKLSFYDGLATQQNAAILGNLLFEKFYNVGKINRQVLKHVQPFGRYLLACLIVTKFNFEGEIIAQFNYFEIATPHVAAFEPKMVDDDVDYLSELLYSKPA